MSADIGKIIYNIILEGEYFMKKIYCILVAITIMVTTLCTLVVMPVTAETDVPEYVTAEYNVSSPSVIPNGDFEEPHTSNALPGWAAAKLDIIYDEAGAYSGSNYLRLASGNTPVYFYLEPNTRYQFSYYYKSNSRKSGFSFNREMQYIKNSDGGYYDQGDYKTDVSLQATGGKWVRYSTQIVTDAATQGMYMIRLRNWGSVATEGVTDANDTNVYFDNLKLEKNLIDNGEFNETWVRTNTSKYGWRTYLDANRVIVNDDAVDGTDGKALKVNGKSHAAYQSMEYDYALKTNTDYVLSFWYKANESGKTTYGGNACLLVTKREGNGVAIADAPDNYLPATNDQWVKKYIYFNSGSIPGNPNSETILTQFYFRCCSDITFDGMCLTEYTVKGGNFDDAQENWIIGNNTVDSTVGYKSLKSLKAENGETTCVATVDAHSRYRLTYYTKGSDTGIVKVTGSDGTVLRQVSNPSSVKWMKNIIDFISPQGSDKKDVVLSFGAGTSAVWFDEITLEKINDDINLTYELVFENSPTGRNLTENFSLPRRTAKKYPTAIDTIRWTSSNPELVKITGYAVSLTRDDYEDIPVTLTAEITIDANLNYKITKVFTAVVKADRDYDITIDQESVLGKVKADFTVQDDAINNSFAILAAYKNKSLVGVVTGDINNQTISLQMDVPAGEAEYRAFIWNNETITPYTEKLFSQPKKTILYQLVPDDDELNLLMSYVIRTKDDKIMVIDGGWDKSGSAGALNSIGYLFEKLQKITNQEKPHIDAWIFTHAHIDHIAEFTKMVEEHAGEFTVDNFYFDFISDDTEAPAETDINAFINAFNTLNGEGAYEKHNSENLTRKGDTFKLGNYVDVTFIKDPTTAKDGLNNASLVFVLETEGQKVLFLGDAGISCGNALLNENSAETLKADIVQMAHHGQNGVGRNVYAAIQAKVALYPANKNVWNNVWKGNETWMYDTFNTRAWMDELGVEENIVAYEGDRGLALPYNAK